MLHLCPWLCASIFVRNDYLAFVNTYGHILYIYVGMFACIMMCALVHMFACVCALVVYAFVRSWIVQGVPCGIFI